jgi:acyl-[acyl carrier protein]--UDP-N-acetylglucosamine O-acyltransferase
VVVGEHASIRQGVVLGHRTQVGARTSIYAGSYIGAGVNIGPDVRIGLSAIILEDAQICTNAVKSASRNARTLQDRVSIGRGVRLHDEVELGPDAIVPNQRTIAFLGNLGRKGRVVTIYGSDTGPLYSVGCQLGITHYDFDRSVQESQNTTSESAQAYMPYLDILNQIGVVVQSAYDNSRPAIEELRALRAALAPPYATG